MNYLFYSDRVIEPPGNVWDDYDIFCKLSDRLGFADRYSEGKTAGQWIEQFLDSSEITDFQLFKQTGVYNGRDQMRIGLADFFADPAKNPLQTPSGKIELASEKYAETGFPAVPVYRGLVNDDQYPLQLITPHSLNRINSSYSNVVWFKERERHVVLMSPEDSASRNLSDGQIVLVSSDRGSLQIPLMVTGDIMEGVICILQGIWPEIDDMGVDHGGATNMLTSTDPTEPSIGSRTHSVSAEVSRIPLNTAKNGNTN